MDIQIEGYGSSHPTIDGRTLTFGYGVLDCVATIDLVFKDEGGDFPTDVLRLTLCVVDESGTKWRTTACFTAGVLIEKMVNILEGDAPMRISDSMKNFQGEPFLSGIVYSTDARNYRDLTITSEDGNETFSIPFKYTSISMDLFDLSRFSSDFGLLEVFSVRVNFGFFDPETGQDVGVFGFCIPTTSLLGSNTAIYCDEEGYERYIDSPLPHPLIFEPLQAGLKPQPGVTVSHRA